MTSAPASQLGVRAMALIDSLSRHTDVPGQLTRLYLSKAHRAAAEETLALMQAAGMRAHIDALGSVHGRYEGTSPGAPALILGSHIDSVVDAGRYDGPLGVVAAIVVVEELAREGSRLPFAIEVLAFGDEENARFPTDLSTSHALAGHYDPAWLDVSDMDGVRLRDALSAFGGDPEGVPALARKQGEVVGYLEIHIEQGPVLEQADLPVGIVSSIAGITRAWISLTGEAGHAGTVPMTMRRDAMACAAEMMGAIERIGGKTKGNVATVGVLKVEPGASNVIPSKVDFTLDARAPSEAQRQPMVRELKATLSAIAARRNIGFDYREYMDSSAVAMDAGLVAVMEQATAAQGIDPILLPSGAGHDAIAMSKLCPSAMIFVRCKGGISHNPAESITAEDADVAIRILLDTVKRLARSNAIAM